MDRSFVGNLLWAVAQGRRLLAERTRALREKARQAKLRERAGKFLGAVLGLVLFSGTWAFFIAAPNITRHHAKTLDWVLFGVAVWWTLAVFFAAVAAFLIGHLIETYRPRDLALDVALGTLSLLALFAFGDWMFSRLNVGSFGAHGLSRPSATYFAISTFTTAGTGKLGPVRGGAQLLVAGQTLVGFALITGVIATIAGRALQVYERRQRVGPAATAGTEKGDASSTA